VYSVLQRLSMYPKWAEGEGSTGEIHLRWNRSAADEGTLRTSLGGTIRYRRVVSNARPF